MLLSLCEIQLPLWSCSMLLLKSTDRLSTEEQTQNIFCALAGEMVSEFLAWSSALSQYRREGQQVTKRRQEDSGGSCFNIAKMGQAQNGPESRMMTVLGLWNIFASSLHPLSYGPMSPKTIHCSLGAPELT